MNIKEENICRLCLKVVEGDYEIIDEIKRNMFEVLLLRVNLDISKDPIVCRECTEISIRCFDFKSTSTNQSKYIIKQENYMKISDDDLKCGFCSHDSSGNDLILLDTLKNDITFADMLQVLMPETDFDVTKNPGICILCRQDLECYIKFAKNCWVVEDKINKHYRNEGIPSFIQIKLSEFLVKNDAESDYIKKELEDISETHSEVYEGKLIKAEEPLDIKDEDVKLQEISDMPVYKLNMPCGLDKAKKPSQGKVFKCALCTFESRHKHNLKCHTLSHKNVTEVEMYRCSVCTYATKYKGGLKKHIVIHKDATQVEMYKCSTCNFQTKRKSSLKGHTLIHKDVTQIEMHKCSICTFETRHKGSLRDHLLIHKNVTEVEMYKCSTCTYETKYKSSLKKHLVIHKNITEIETYKCSTCTFQAKRKSDLRTHALFHKDVSEIEMYKCSTCTYETKHKRYLHSHMLVHKDVAEVKMYKCSKCTFQTRHKGSLKDHLLIHKDITEVETYKCPICTHETKHKRYLHTHMLTHKDNK